MSTKRRLACPHCGGTVECDRYHAGFSNLGYMYCDQDETVLTWETYDPTYLAIVGDKHPWMLNLEEQGRVESSLKECPFGGRFRFANLPRCPRCNNPFDELGVDKIYFVVLGRQLEASRDGLWSVAPAQRS